MSQARALPRAARPASRTRTRGVCSPTITFFTPCGGAASWGTVVTIYRDNLDKELRHRREPPVGGDVRFSPYTDTATHTGIPESPRQLSVVVPARAADGRIRVSTFNDKVGEGPVLGAGFVVSPRLPLSLGHSDFEACDPACGEVPGRSGGQRRHMDSQPARRAFQSRSSAASLRNGRP